VGVYWAKYYFPDHSADKFDVVNGDVDCFEKLNDNSGADYVKTTGKCPANCEKLPALDRIASLDGDCDRLIYSFYNSKGDFCVVDGDFQAILFASFIYEKLCEMNLDDEARKNFTFGIATTRYANGALDKALQKYSDWLQIMKGETGVANISRLINKLDVGIFFEANGHGS
uniref:Phosphoglucomutase n=1 Tax=Panagrolaimus sp. JU765 TaxID=591449 RepID=A0AC34RN35_9BILA